VFVETQELMRQDQLDTLTER